MTDWRKEPGRAAEHPQATQPNRQATKAGRPRNQKNLSMHEGVPVWHDCCSCEAEPYWTAPDAAPEPDADNDDNSDRDQAAQRATS